MTNDEYQELENEVDYSAYYESPALRRLQTRLLLGILEELRKIRKLQEESA